MQEGLDNSINALIQKAPEAHLYVLRYPRFFNDQTEQCNEIQFMAWCTGKVSPTLPVLPLTMDRRSRMNALTNNLNTAISNAVLKARANGANIRYIDPNPYFEGHRFCEPQTQEPSFRNPDIYFYPYEFSQGETAAYISTVDNTTDCEANYDNDGDQGNYFACQLAEVVNANPNVSLDALDGPNGTAVVPAGDDDVGVTGSGSIALPDALARIFHPTILGMTAYRNAIAEEISNDYPAAAASASSTAAPPAPAPSTSSATSTTSASSTTSAPSTSSAPSTTSAPSATPSSSLYAFEVYNREVLVANRGSYLDTWAWEGVSIDQSSSNYDLCDANQVPPLIHSAYDHSAPAPTYPTSLGTFNLTNHPTCSYQGPNSDTVGSLTCNDGYQASCTVYPASQQTQYVDCTPNQGSRDWWYYNLYCYYS